MKTGTGYLRSTSMILMILIWTSFSEKHPYIYQSMTARMLEATRKGYWDAPDDVLETLVSEYAQSVVENGPACCHHTCGNPILGDEYIPGLISAFGLSSDLNAEYGATMESVTERGKTAAKGGVGKDAGKPANPSEQLNPSEDYVKGYEMEVETSEFSTGLSFSGAPMIGMVLVIALMVVIYWGYRRRY